MKTVFHLIFCVNLDREIRQQLQIVWGFYAAWVYFILIIQSPNSSVKIFVQALALRNWLQLATLTEWHTFYQICQIDSFKSVSQLLFFIFFGQSGGGDGSIAVDHFTFSSSIAEHLRSASLVISHAGKFLVSPFLPEFIIQLAITLMFIYSMCV